MRPQFSLAGMVGEAVPGFLNAKGEWPRQMATMVVDGLAIVVGSCLGETSCLVLVINDDRHRSWIPLTLMAIWTLKCRVCL